MDKRGVEDITTSALHTSICDKINIKLGLNWE